MNKRIKVHKKSIDIHLKIWYTKYSKRDDKLLKT